MISINVFFLLTVLKVNVAWTTASNVHEMMTPEEIFQTFGTDDVPDYQVIYIVLQSARRIPANDELHFKFKINDTEINLLFKPTAGYLATRYTPVWSAVTDQKAYNKIRYDPLPNAMKDIGEFKMYHDVNNEAAIVVYTDPDHEAIIEGFVTADYAIRSLPKRLINQTLKVETDHFIEKPVCHKRSIEPDADKVTGYYVLFKSTFSVKNAERNVYRHVEKRQSNSRTYIRMMPEAVYPEILLVLDHNAIRNHTITQALRFMLALWNGVDMVYSTLKNPKVYLNIAGIIISADDAATPYIAKDTSIKIKTLRDFSLGGLANYFGAELDRFPLSQYDIIFAMTTITHCLTETDDCQIVLGTTSSSTACTSEREAKIWQRIEGVALVYYNWTFGGVQTAVHESAHLFEVKHDIGIGSTAQCDYEEGYAMAAIAKFRNQSLKWSPCSESFFRNYFSLTKSECLDNTPMWTNPVKEVLPGRWLTLDGQCRNSGFEKSCPFLDLPVCIFNGCIANSSNECTLSANLPLPGTKCGENKYCLSGNGCVDE